jgi:hypothetical protein
MIVAQAVTNQVVDMGLLNETTEPARALLDVESMSSLIPALVRGPMAPPLALRQNLNPHRPADLKCVLEVACFADRTKQSRRSSPEGHMSNPFEWTASAPAIFKKLA